MSCATARNTGRSTLGDETADSSVTVLRPCTPDWVLSWGGLSVNGRSWLGVQERGDSRRPRIAERIAVGGLELPNDRFDAVSGRC